MPLLMHHWYWGRARVGEYRMITSYITAQRKYGHEHFPIFMLARGGEIIGDDVSKLTYRQLDPAYDETTGKHYHRTLVYDYDDTGEGGAGRYRITCRVEGFLERSRSLRKPLQRAAASLAGMDPSYCRFAGTAVIERLDGDGTVMERDAAPAIWELMYLGNDTDV